MGHALPLCAILKNDEIKGRKMREKMIIPAIIAKNQEELDERILKVADYVELIQLDFMDGKFVPNSSIDFDFTTPTSDCVYEAHLMVADPEGWIDKHSEKVDMILVHYESCSNHEEIISLARAKGKKIGFVLNPETPVEKLSEFINDIDQVLIMTVNPGFYGSPFLPDMMDKISAFRKMRADLDIEVDGGVTDKTIGLVDEAGANMFVSGSFIVKAPAVKEAVATLEKIVNS